MSVPDKLKDILPSFVRRPLGRIAGRIRLQAISGDLNRLALHCCTDKWGAHWYTQHYQQLFLHLRHRPLNLLEIGVGGYKSTTWGGMSLRMWKAFFPKARIVGIDIYDKTGFSEDRIDIRQCDQTDSEKLRLLSAEYGGFDIIIDDGSHLNEHVITTFKILFPLLRPAGIYAIEDTQTAYWPSWGGGANNPDTLMEFFKGLVDGINYAEVPREGYVPSYFDQNILGISFFHNLVIVRKGENTEGTNAPELVQKELELARAS